MLNPKSQFLDSVTDLSKIKDLNSFLIDTRPKTYCQS